MNQHFFRILLLASLVCFWSCCPVQAADDHNQLESSLFAEDIGASVTASAASVPAAQTGTPAPAPNPILNLTPDAKSVAFSGDITSAVVAAKSASLDANALYTLTYTDIYLDARLPRNAKVFADVEATYLSQSQATSVALQELFMDFNLDQAVYFRAGKQVLQWGRCYLWNPTDMINIERTPFIRKLGTRAGAYGIKLHVPFGTTMNIYGFIDTGTAADAESTAESLKVEYLLGNLEMALSGWGKKGYHPAWGLDFSTRLFGIDTLGEVSLRQGDNQFRVQEADGQLFLEKDSERTTPRASLDFSRSFTVGDFKDRLTIMLEGYYDRAGYDSNVLANSTDYAFAQPAGMSPAVTHGTWKDFINLNHLYQPNYFSRSYSAVFMTFARFLLPDMSLSANYIRNWVDQSYLISSGVTYTELNSFTFGFLGNVYLGAPDSEYTFSGEKYDLQLTFALSF